MVRYSIPRCPTAGNITQAVTSERNPLPCVAQSSVGLQGQFAQVKVALLKERNRQEGTEGTHVTNE